MVFPVGFVNIFPYGISPLVNIIVINFQDAHAPNNICEYLYKW